MSTPGLPASHIEATTSPGSSGPASGANAASNFCGIGVSGTPNVNPKLQDWTLLDQAEAARDPQLTQPLGWGGDSIVTGQLTADLPPLLVVDYEAGGGDGEFDLQYVFDVADQQATIVGGTYNTVSGAKLCTVPESGSIEIGERAWGKKIGGGG